MADARWDRRPPEAIERDQSQLLADWVSQEVVPFSAFWRERLSEVRLKALTDLPAVPIVEEAEAATVGGPGNPDLLLQPTEEQFKRHGPRADVFAAAREVAGRGVDGRRAALFRRYKPLHVHEAGVAVLLAVAYTRTDLDRLHLAGARLMEVLGLGADDSLANLVPAGPSVRFWGLYHAALAARMTALHPRGAGEDPVLPAARALALLPATVLAAPVDEAADLLDGLADRGVRAPQLRTLLVVGRPPSALERNELAELAAQLGATAVRVQAVWAPEAARALWGECRPPGGDPDEATYGLHTYPDLEVLEVRDVPGDRLATPGEPGEIVYTSLGWRGTAFVRLATGAWTGGLAAGIPCPSCGRTVPRLSPAVRDGAWQPRVAVDGGRAARIDLRKAHRALHPAVLTDLGVRDWSLRVVERTLVLGLDLDGPAGEGVVDLARAVGAAVGALPEVRIGPRAASARPQVGDAG